MSTAPEGQPRYCRENARLRSDRWHRAHGIMPRRPAQRPWLAEWVSRSTWYRRRKQARERAGRHLKLPAGGKFFPAPKPSRGNCKPSRRGRPVPDSRRRDHCDHRRAFARHSFEVLEEGRFRTHIGGRREQLVHGFLIPNHNQQGDSAMSPKKQLAAQRAPVPDRQADLAWFKAHLSVRACHLGWQSTNAQDASG